MVWSFGFGNDGAPVHVGHEALDGNRRLIEYVDTTIDWDGGENATFKPGLLHAGRPIKPDHVPTRVVRLDRKWGIPDVDWGVGMYFGNDKFKQVVEQLEPGVHQFFPVDMLWKDGSLAQKMYMFNICSRLDTVSRKDSTAQKPKNYWKPETGKLVFSLQRVGGHHIWIDKHVYHGRYMSDAMHDALQEAGVTGIGFERRNATEAL
jgi:hypothetical protein